MRGGNDEEIGGNCMTPTTESDRKCETCKWNDLFWEESGCSKFNAMEPCGFEPKEVRHEDNGCS